MTKSLTVEMNELSIPDGWMLGPRSYLVDRALPAVETVFLEGRSVGGGQITLETGVFDFEAPRKKRKSLWSSDEVVHHTGPKQVIDLRDFEPENWAHFLNNHLAILAVAARGLDCVWQDFTVLLPAKSPSYLKALIELLGLDTIFTDAKVQAKGVRISLSRRNALRGERVALLADPRLSPVAHVLASQTVPRCEAGKRLFVSRKSDRALKNEAEVEDILVQKGFEKIYPEEHTVAQQLGLISSADTIVAIHGAALAPMLYRDHRKADLKLVEIFPVGHITNVYRMITAGLGGQWVGVRGLLEAKHVPELYKLDEMYTKHSLDNFSVDAASVEAALKRLSIT